MSFEVNLKKIQKNNFKIERIFFHNKNFNKPIKTISGRFNLLHEMCLKYPQTLKLWLGPSMLWVLINDPKMIQKVLLSPICLEKPFFYKFLRLNSGLISSKCKFFREECSENLFVTFVISFLFLAEIQTTCGRFTENRWIIPSTWRFSKLSFQFLSRTQKNLLRICQWMTERRMSLTFLTTHRKVHWAWSVVRIWRNL